jgi:hypothetical protein
MIDVGGAIALLRYYAGWADKVHGQTIEVRSSDDDSTSRVTNVLPRPMKTSYRTLGTNPMELWYGFFIPNHLQVAEFSQGQIIPWNFPLVRNFYGWVSKPVLTFFKFMTCCKIAPALVTGNTVLLKVTFRSATESMSNIHCPSVAIRNHATHCSQVGWAAERSWISTWRRQYR